MLARSHSMLYREERGNRSEILGWSEIVWVSASNFSRAETNMQPQFAHNPNVLIHDRPMPNWVQANDRQTDFMTASAPSAQLHWLLQSYAPVTRRVRLALKQH